MPTTDEIDAAFANVARAMGDAFEPRPQQVAMARAVDAALGGGRIAVLEAATGLGKSLAYLVPILAWCRRTGGRAVVSTRTRNLQRQLVDKDIPVARAATGADVGSALLMGRSSYVCRRGVERVLARDDDDRERQEWVRALLDSADGDLDAVPGGSVHLDARLRPTVSAPWKEVVCAGCAHREACFLFAARRRAQAAQLVVVNHALLFSDAAAGRGLIGPYDVLIVDEAHHLHDVATEALSLAFSPRTIRGGARSLYTPELDEIVASVRARVAMTSPEGVSRVDGAWGRFHAALDAAQSAAAALFERLGERAVGGRGDEPVVYREGSAWLAGAEGVSGELDAALGAMAREADAVAEAAEAHGVPADSGSTQTLRSLARAGAETVEEVRFLTSASDEDYVFYASRLPGGEVGSLCAAPIDVGPQLGAAVEELAGAAVLTSATLAVGGDFAHALSRLGLERSPRVDVGRFDAPFDVDARRRVIVARAAPDPSSAAFIDAATETIVELDAALSRRMLVLCTARTQLDALDERLREAGLGPRVYAQRDGVSRTDLLARFLDDPASILLGLASFWEGVDLPGDAVEVVVIVKLPFLVPSDPLVRARTQRAGERGENAFEHIFIPDVVLKMRQGIGRLIRTGSDRGAVIVLDRRLWHGRYGRAVMDAVAPEWTPCDGVDAIVTSARAAFEPSPDRPPR